MESRLRHAFQDNRDLPDLREDQERMPDVPAGPRIWAAHASPGHRAAVQVGCAEQRHQQGVLCTEYGVEGAWLDGIVGGYMLMLRLA